MKFMKLGSKPDTFQTDSSDNSRYVATELASDITVDVDGVKFYLHKFPLLSKSARLHKLVAAASEENNDEIEIPDIPGGPSAFEICAKFCYGMTVTLNCYNVIAARCAAEYLEMHETIEKGNLVYKIEVFLSSGIFRSWKDSIIVLQTTKSLLPWSEDLKVINRCIDSIASKACIETSMVEWSYTYNRKKLPSENGLDQNWNGVMKQQVVPKDWWVEDLCELDLEYYKRVILAIKAKERLPTPVIGESIKAYAYRRLPGFNRGNVSFGGDSMKYCMFVETIIWLLPAEAGTVSCSFLLKLLKASIALDSGESEMKELTNRIGRQLEEASVPDLLIPANANDDMMYDIDLILNIVEEFVMQEHEEPQDTNEVLEVRSPPHVPESSKVAVAKLIDGYLAEVARDPNLPLSKFIDLAEMVSSVSRLSHDGLYRAIDMYLKEHPSLEKSEKKKICGLMNCRKLSADACMHAIQNERLPMRVIVQILFFEQMRASSSAAATNLAVRENGTSHGSSRSAATTTTDEDWDGAPTANDTKSLKSMALVGSERSSGSSGANKLCEDDKSNGNKVKGLATPRKIISRLWSSKGHSVENSSSDTSESPGSINIEESKSTPSRSASHRG